MNTASCLKQSDSVSGVGGNTLAALPRTLDGGMRVWLTLSLLKRQHDLIKCQLHFCSLLLNVL